MAVIRFHPEGKYWIGGSLAAGLIGMALWFFLGGPVWVGIALGLGWLVWMALVLNFFRYPVRTSPGDPSVFYAPCDGKVVSIHRTFEPRYFHTEMRQVSIFMSPLDVHVNWAPAAGQVVFLHHTPGLYKVAWHPKSSLLNEQTFVAVGFDEGGGYALRQIAGFLARRIKTYLTVGERVRPGQEVGFIKFGSRVDVLLPLSAEVLVQPGMRVRGALTPIARW